MRLGADDSTQPRLRVALDNAGEAAGRGAQSEGPGVLSMISAMLTLAIFIGLCWLGVEIGWASEREKPLPPWWDQED